MQPQAPIARACSQRTHLRSRRRWTSRSSITTTTCPSSLTACARRRSPTASSPSRASSTCSSTVRRARTRACMRALRRRQRTETPARARAYADEGTRALAGIQSTKGSLAPLSSLSHWSYSMTANYSKHSPILRHFRSLMRRRSVPLHSLLVLPHRRTDRVQSFSHVPRHIRRSSMLLPLLTPPPLPQLSQAPLPYVSDCNHIP
eukprot:6191189-Pleurochrysis_carterae.AAC.4